MRVLWLTLFIVAADQITKVWVKLTMLPHESIRIIGDLFKITFTENPGWRSASAWAPSSS